jgi:hypothetical protein
MRWVASFQVAAAFGVHELFRRDRVVKTPCAMSGSDEGTGTQGPSGRALDWNMSRMGVFLSKEVERVKKA